MPPHPPNHKIKPLPHHPLHPKPTLPKRPQTPPVLLPHIHRKSPIRPFRFKPKLHQQPNRRRPDPPVPEILLNLDIDPPAFQPRIPPQNPPHVHLLQPALLHRPTLELNDETVGAARDAAHDLLDLPEAVLALVRVGIAGNLRVIPPPKNQPPIPLRQRPQHHRPSPQRHVMRSNRLMHQSLRVASPILA